MDNPGTTRTLRFFKRDPLGNISRICYNAFNLPVSTTDANGIVTKYAYNDAGLVTRMERLDGSETLAALQGDGLPPERQRAVGVEHPRGRVGRHEARRMILLVETVAAVQVAPAPRRLHEQ